MNIAESLEKSQQRLASSSIGTPRLDSLVLLEHTTNKDRSWLLAHADEPITKANWRKYQKLIAWRSKRIPLSQIIGRQEFWGLEFKITKDVLAPRPESEKIVEFALQRQSSQEPMKVLDVGTGCGALAIAIAKERPDWQVTATEVSDKALAVARANVKKHGVKVRCLKSDLFSTFQSRPQGSTLETKFDIVVANLPYLKKGSELTTEATNEPDIALFGGKDGLDIYRLFFSQLPSHISKNSLVIIESDPWQQPPLIELANSISLKVDSKDRFVLSFKN